MRAGQAEMGAGRAGWDAEDGGWVHIISAAGGRDPVIGFLLQLPEFL